MGSMKNVQLSDRLRAVASLAAPGSRIADVGCDHGYIPIYLYLEGRIPGAIAMDVNRGPLLRAEQHIREYGLGKYIETRLSDGVKALAPGEADTVIIAGMGGPLMEKILTEGRSVLESVSELILQPQSEIGAFRHYLLEHGYRITAEDMVFEEGKYYPMMKVLHGEQSYGDETEYLFGRGLLDSRNPGFLNKFSAKGAVICGKDHGASEKDRHQSRQGAAFGTGTGAVLYQKKHLRAFKSRNHSLQRNHN